MSAPNCLICNQPMKLEKKLKSVNSKFSGNKFRLRRYSCILCNYSEMKTANGERERWHEDKALDEVKQMYNQQSENNI